MTARLGSFGSASLYKGVRVKYWEIFPSKTTHPLHTLDSTSVRTVSSVMISDRSQYLPLPYGQLSNQNPVRPVTLPYNPTSLSFSPVSPFDSLSSITKTQNPISSFSIFSSASAQSHNRRPIVSPTAPSLFRRTSSQRRRHAPDSVFSARYVRSATRHYISLSNPTN